MRRSWSIAAFVVGCGSGSAAPGPAASTEATPAPNVSTSPGLSRSPSAPASSAPVDLQTLGNCYTEATSRSHGGPATADAPFEKCARKLKVHCGGRDGERGGLHGLALLVEETTRARQTQPDACCYATCD